MIMIAYKKLEEESKVININNLYYKKFFNTYNLTNDEKWTIKKKRDIAREMKKGYMAMLSKFYENKLNKS